MTTPLIERFRERLPVSDSTPVVSLGEGSTPLLEAPRLARAAGVRELWLKWEASNPTGSYKDRGMTVAVSKALEQRRRALAERDDRGRVRDGQPLAEPLDEGSRHRVPYF